MTRAEVACRSNPERRPGAVGQAAQSARWQAPLRRMTCCRTRHLVAAWISRRLRGTARDCRSWLPRRAFCSVRVQREQLTTALPCGVARAEAGRTRLSAPQDRSQAALSNAAISASTSAGEPAACGPSAARTSPRSLGPPGGAQPGSQRQAQHHLAALDRPGRGELELARPGGVALAGGLDHLVGRARRRVDGLEDRRRRPGRPTASRSACRDRARTSRARTPRSARASRGSAAGRGCPSATSAAPGGFVSGQVRAIATHSARVLPVSRSRLACIEAKYLPGAR